MSTMNPAATFGPQLPPEPEVELPEGPSLDDLVTEDHKPVERIYIEKQLRLLTHPLYASWPGPGEGRPFLVLANVGWFYKESTPPVAPDCLLSLDVACPEDVHVKAGHSYYQWKVGKPPEVVVEIVSDKTGGEETLKKKLYAKQGVAYYAIFDPEQVLGDEILRTWQLRGGQYEAVESDHWPEIGLGLRLWEGTFEGLNITWLRWCDEKGEVIPTGEERAQRERERADRAEARVRELEEALRRRNGPSAEGSHAT
jgi:Uma2 family endonuclease